MNDFWKDRSLLSPEAYASEINALLTKATTGLIEQGAIGIEIVKTKYGSFQIIFRHGRFGQAFYSDIKQINEYRDNGILEGEMHKIVEQGLMAILRYRIDQAKEETELTPQHHCTTDTPVHQASIPGHQF